MELIYHYGLNCRLAAIVNIASLLGVNYLEAYCSLWSETDFENDKEYNIFVSKRIYKNLKTAGLTIQLLDCEKLKSEGGLRQIKTGEYFVVGLDAFNIPWHPVYGHFHGRHFIFALKESDVEVRCFDPVYNGKDVRLNSCAIFSSAFEVCRIIKSKARPINHGLQQEAEEILLSRLAMEEILSDIESCKSGGKQKINIILKQITAMINNRCLFAKYFHSLPVSQELKAFFDKTYLLKWEGVKNGLYKASILKDNQSAIGEVCDLFFRLINEEEEAAKTIIYTGTNKKPSRPPL